MSIEKIVELIKSSDISILNPYASLDEIKSDEISIMDVYCYYFRGSNRCVETSEYLSDLEAIKENITEVNNKILEVIRSENFTDKYKTVLTSELDKDLIYLNEEKQILLSVLPKKAISLKYVSRTSTDLCDDLEIFSD